MHKRMVGMASVVFVLLLISSFGININQNRDNDINYLNGEEFPITSFNFTGNLTCYCAPDNSYEAFNSLLDSVKENLYISVYEFQNIHLARSISNLSEKGVSVKILVDSDPVSGVSKQEKYCLKIMDAEGVEIKKTDPENFDYSYLHSKYIVADDEQVLISSENFGYTGYPVDNSYGNRGWGVVVESSDTADYYKNVFYYDWNNSKNMNISFEESSNYQKKKGGYSCEFGSMKIMQDIKVTPVIGPEQSLSNDTILNMIKEAEHSIYVQQFYIDDWKKNPYIQVIIDAAERGCEIKFLLDSTWYNIKKDEKDNDDFVDYMHKLSSKKGLDIECRLLNQYHGFSKSHNKGMIVDEKKVLISSINWNMHSINSNREVGIIIENNYTANYFQNIFMHDWDDDLIKPIPEAGQDRKVLLGKETTFDGSKSWDDNKIKSYQWDLNGDGIFEKSGKIINHTYEQKGEYKIKLKVIDQEGHISVDESVVKVESKNDSKSGIYYTLLMVPIFFTILSFYWKKLKK